MSDINKAEANGQYTHGHHINGKPSHTYKSWRSLKQRCNLTTGKDYNRYGGRGITYDPRWESFENFLADMGERPEGTTIDRINVDGNYEASNCRWATPKEQANNRRPASIQARSSSGYIGVTWWTVRNVWRASIVIEGKQKHLGYFDYPETAYYVRENYVSKLNENKA